MRFKNGPVKLEDCELHGASSGAELFVVEGDSAARAVCNVRDPHYQAVLPMQGKPINAYKAKRSAIHSNELFLAIYESLGFKTERVLRPEECRFERIILLFDPDADGIHCGALMLMFFHKMMFPLLEGGKICLVRAPLFELQVKATAESDYELRYAYTEEHAFKLIQDLELLNMEVQRTRYRGLASMGEKTLLQTCLDPKRRTLNRLRPEDAEAAIAMFGGGRM